MTLTLILLLNDYTKTRNSLSLVRGERKHSVFHENQQNGGSSAKNSVPESLNPVEYSWNLTYPRPVSE